MKRIVIAAVAAVAVAVGAAPVAGASPNVRCSPAPCKVRTWEDVFAGDPWGKAFANAPWEKIVPGKKADEPAKKGPWEKAFENAPMP